MNPSLIHLVHADATHAERTSRRRFPSHAFVVPVVRELPAQSMRLSPGSAW
jgi:hypothetical protein